ncbi:Type III pantothenate kinase [Pseudoalteromonas holothuriae]|uniref:Type III pantothenate kinase n=1 Tax=Pseudoalteromonas holothuriae TaxID=2963714 RepID=A0A9W4W3B3_9GAMM|nr:MULTISPECIES: type III pantothenate kinase [unclassified Pseudoalteromonas]CAH9065680.1 Type III pantothenate kinase [Pseudoalteromonas sp. CIP111951]CAH9066437.1 Type III pantothenate kinase [Pseudoalteromonas sp. CIP111854]
MQLLIDVGNTAVKLALARNDYVTLIDDISIPWNDISEVLVAQVGKSDALTPYIDKAQVLGIPVVQAYVTQTLNELRCAYAHYHNLGIDRWLTVVACHYLYPKQNCVIVDSGTATKVDILTAKGEHLGGWILPGLDMMVDSLVNNTQKVFSDEQSLFTKALGKNTPNAVKNGALVATLGAIYAGMQSFECETSALKVICAGGYGEFISQQLMCESQYNDILVLQGLLFWRKNIQI